MNSKRKSHSFQKFKLACLGGTFDQFHKGHEFFLEKAFEVAQEIIIGVTSDNFAQKKVLPQAISSLEKRKEEVKNFLKKKGLLKRAEIIKIEGVFDPRILDPKITCLVVSEKTKEKAKFLNQKRVENRLPPLKVVVIPLVVDKEGKCITGTRIRLGEIDRKGELIVEPNFFKKTHRLPQKLRPPLKRPFGRLILGSEKNLKEAALELKRKLRSLSFTRLIAVGDIVTLSLTKEGIIPDLSIIDFKVRREKIYQDIAQLGFSSNMRVKKVKNRPGTLSPALFLAIKEWVKNSLVSKEPLVIKVLGEEDLAVLPAVLLSPLSSLICYGQHRKGIVTIQVTEEKKGRIRKLLRQFFAK